MTIQSAFILAVGLVLAAGACAIAHRYELQTVTYSRPMGRLEADKSRMEPDTQEGRSIAWRLDRWTGEICRVGSNYMGGLVPLVEGKSCIK